MEKRMQEDCTEMMKEETPSSDFAAISDKIRISMDEPEKTAESLLHHRNGCSISLMLILSTPRLAASMSWAAQYSALSPHLESYLPSYAVMLTQFLGPLLGMFISPTIGALSDQCTSKYGRRRPFLVGGAISFVICWTLMGFTRELGQKLGDGENEGHYTGILSIIFFTWMGITVNCFSTPAQLILADFAGPRQTTAASIGQAAFTLGPILVATYIEIFGPAHKTLHEFLGVLSVIMFLSVGSVCLSAKEKPNLADSKRNFKSVIKNALQSVYSGVSSLPSQLIIFGIVFFCRCYGSTSYHGAKGQFFGLVVYGGEKDGIENNNNLTKKQEDYLEGVQLAGGRADIMFNLTSYFASLLVPYFVKRFGAKKVVTFGMIPQCLFVIMAISRVVEVDVAIVTLTALTQAFVDGTLVPVVIHILAEKNEPNIGLYVGAFNSWDCLGQLVNFGVAAILVTSDMGYALPILVGGVVSFLGFLIACFFFKTNFYGM